MNANWYFHKYFVFTGVILSVCTFISYYFFIEDTIHDHRITLSVNSSEYNLIKPRLGNYASQIDMNEYFIAPNFESIADTLISSNIRRFELKLSTPDIINIDTALQAYFENQIQTSSPDKIRHIRFDDSTPLQRSIGYALIILCCFMLVDILFISKRSKKENHKNS